jgi:hypothetical protein
MNTRLSLFFAWLVVAGCDPTAGGLKSVCKPGGPVPPGREDLVEVDRRDPWAQDGRPGLPLPGCGDSAFFIDTPQGAPTPCEAFPEALKARLDVLAKEQMCNFAADAQSFCQVGCASDGTASFTPREGVEVRARLTPVFTEVPGDDRDPRTTAHRRFHRLEFERVEGGTGVPIPVDAETLCGTVDSLRAAAADALGESCPEQVEAWSGRLCGGPPGEGGVDFLVGRECAIGGAATATNPEALTWQFGRLGLDGRAAPGQRGEVTAEEVAKAQVALIDTGAEPASFPAGAEFLRSDGTVDTTGPWNPHGAWMLGHMQSINPAATYASFRALDVDGRANGFGTTQAVAQAVEHAVRRVADESPLVLNLSLGWPEVLSRARRIEGIFPTAESKNGKAWTLNGQRGSNGVCGAVEDGPGEALRWVLSYVRGRERLRQGAPVSVLTAAGNHGLDRPIELTKHAALAMGGVRCEASDFGSSSPSWSRLRQDWCRSVGSPGELRRGESLYAPALWGTTDGGWNPWLPDRCFKRLRLSTHIGAINGFDQPVLTAGPKSEPALVAPGAQVYLEAPLFREGVEPVEAPCGPSVPAGAATAPIGVTGTSVSTAFASSIAAYVQGALVKGGRNALTARGLARFLYLTGPGLRGGAGASSREGVPVHRVNLCGARRVLNASAECIDGFVACLVKDELDRRPEDDLDATGWFDAAALKGCEEIQKECEMLPEPNCPDDRLEPGWSEDWPDAGTSICENFDCTPGSGTPCASTAWSSGPVTTTAVGANSEVYVERAAAGIAGPQPINPECIECGLRYTSTSTPKRMTVVFQITTGTTGTYTSALLTISAPSGTPVETVDLKAASGGSLSTWKGGQTIRYNNLLAPVVANGKTLSNDVSAWKTYQARLVAQRSTGTTTVTEPVLLRITAQ